MMWRTHQLFGFVAAAETLIYLKEPILSLSSAAAVIGGMLVAPLADVDEPNSIPAKSAFPLAWLCEVLRIRHRTLTHSILFAALLFWIVKAFPTHGAFGLNWYVIGIGLWAGYVSHPAIDLLNPGGVGLLWPLPMKIILPVTVPVNGRAEELIKHILGVAGYVVLFQWFYVSVSLMQQAVDQAWKLISKII